MESGKYHFLQKMLSLHFLMMFISQPFSAFAFVTSSTASEQKNQCKNMRFKFRFLLTHHSTIPLFQYSNWGEAPKFDLAVKPFSNGRRPLIQFFSQKGV